MGAAAVPGALGISLSGCLPSFSTHACLSNELIWEASPKHINRPKHNGVRPAAFGKKHAASAPFSSKRCTVSIRECWTARWSAVCRSLVTEFTVAFALSSNLAIYGDQGATRCEVCMVGMS